MLVIISCGQRKQNKRSRAGELYTGPYFRAALAYAKTIATTNRIFILSAKYGLVSLDTWLEPYDMRLGAPHSVTVAQVQKQAQQLGILPVEDTLMVIAGKPYQKFLKEHL